MSVQIYALSFDAKDPAGLARFWAGVLGRDLGADGTSVLPDNDLG